MKKSIKKTSKKITKRKKKVENAKEPEIGTIRIRAKDLATVEKTKTGWKKSTISIDNIQHIVHQYKMHANFNILLNTKDKKFLKGELNAKGQIRGERINTLPNGTKLDKAFSLFAPNLTIHDEKTNDHWDVIFQNPNGSLAHLYSIEKTKKSKDKKYKEVKEFKKRLPQLERRLEKAIKNKELIALPLYTLIKTYMRVGNLHSYKSRGHKGLTTLNKENIKITKNGVTFDYIGKDGVPQKTSNKFPNIYTVNLEKHLKPLKKGDLVFKNTHGGILRDTHLEEGFKKYTGRKFYPHIVRSYYATEKVAQFLHKNPHPSKEEVKQLYNEIAEKLGHKRFSIKNNTWNVNHSITVSHYIDPKLVEKINQIILKS
jgi:hypothetical protein